MEKAYQMNEDKAFAIDFFLETVLLLSEIKQNEENGG